MKVSTQKSCMTAVSSDLFNAIILLFNNMFKSIAYPYVLGFFGLCPLLARKRFRIKHSKQRHKHKIFVWVEVSEIFMSVFDLSFNCCAIVKCRVSCKS
jgi:hypothetical protein